MDGDRRGIGRARDRWGGRIAVVRVRRSPDRGVGRRSPARPRSFGSPASRTPPTRSGSTRGGRAPSGGRAVDRGRGRPRDPPADGGDRGPRTRSPVAVARGAVTSLMAGDGTALGSGRSLAGLPVIELGGAGRVEGIRPSPVGAARALGAMAPALRAQVARVRRPAGRDPRAPSAEDGPTVRFGTPEDAERKAVTIRRMLAWAGRARDAANPLGVVRARAAGGVRSIRPELRAVVTRTITGLAGILTDLGFDSSVR